MSTRGRSWCRAIGAAAVLLGSVAAPAAAQTVDDALRFTQRAPAASEARTLGMGGAGRAGVADATALFYNPAGLGWMSTSSASGSLAFIGTENDARFQGNTAVTDADDYGGHAALTYKFPTARGSLVFAGGFNQINTFGRNLGYRGRNGGSSITQALLPFDDEYRIDGDFIEWSGSVLPQIAYEGGAIEFYPETDEYDAEFLPAVFSGTEAEQIGTVQEEGRLSELSFGAGVAVAPNVMLGLSANFTYGRYQYRNMLSELDDGANDDYEVVRGNAVYRGLDEVQFEDGFESDLAGINLRGGLSAEAVPGVRLGVTVETPTFLQVNESFVEGEVTTYFDDGGTLSYGGGPSDYGVGETEYRVQTPWRLGAGGQANLLALTDGVADLSLFGDVEFVDWSQMRLDSEFTDFSEDNLDAEEGFGAVINTNLGVEYRVVGLALRAGFAYRPDPRELSLAAEPQDEAADRVFYSLGAGYRFAENFQIDVGWMQEQQQGETFYAYEGAPSVNEDVTRSRLLVGVRYLF